MKHWTRQAVASIHTLNEPQEDVFVRIAREYRIDVSLLEASLQDKVKVLELDQGTIDFVNQNPPTGTHASNLI